MFDYPSVVFPPAGVTSLINERPQDSHRLQQKFLCIDWLMAILTNMNKQRNTMKQQMKPRSAYGSFGFFWFGIYVTNKTSSQTNRSSDAKNVTRSNNAEQKLLNITAKRCGLIGKTNATRKTHNVCNTPLGRVTADNIFGYP